MFDRMVHERPYSEDTAREIDAEVESLIKEAAQRAELVLKANKKYLDVLKGKLLEKETLEAEEVEKVLKDATLPAAVKLY
jgi:cell division protease FtsH